MTVLFDTVLTVCVLAITAWVLLGTGLPASGRHHHDPRQLRRWIRRPGSRLP